MPHSFDMHEISFRYSRYRIHFFFLLDRSGSMYGTRINNLNKAMANILTKLADFGRMEETEVLMHILAFDDYVQWLCNTTAEHGVRVQDIQWTDLTAGGSTNTAAAIRAIKPGLSNRSLSIRAYRPVIVQITDGASNSNEEMLKAVKEITDYQKTIRVGIGVESYNASELNAFASPANYRTEDALGNLSDPERRPLVFTVDKATELTSLLENVALSTMKASILLEQERPEESSNEQEERAIPVVIPEEEPFLL